MKTGAQRFVPIVAMLCSIANAHTRTPFAGLVSTRVQNACAMIQQGKTSRTKPEDTRFGVVIGVVRAYQSPFFPANKGNREIG